MHPSGGDATRFNRTDPNLDHSTGKTYADSSAEGYLRDNDGFVNLRTLARGTTVNSTFDVAGDLTARSYSDATPAISITRNELGNPILATDGIGTHTFSWNKRGQVTTANGPYGNVSCAYAPDHTFRTNLSVTVGGKTMTVSYTYSGARLDTISWRKTGDAAPATFTYTYHPNSDLMAAIQSDRGMTLAHNYETNIDRLTAITATTSTGGPLASIQFLAYTPQDKVQEISYSTGERLRFDYGDDGSLGPIVILDPPVPGGTPSPKVAGLIGPAPVAVSASSTYSASGASPTSTIVQVLDGAGNRRQYGVVTYSPNALNLYTSASSTYPPPTSMPLSYDSAA